MPGKERTKGKDDRKAARAVFDVHGMDCGTCALAVERRLKKLEGVESVGSALMLDKVFVDYDDTKVSVSQIMDAIAQTGYANHLTRKS